MTLQELKKGQSILVQVSWGHNITDISCMVIGINDFGEGILVHPDKHPTVLFNLNKGRGMICDVYMTNPDEGERLEWANVFFHICEYNNNIYYVIKTKEDEAKAKPSDRRGSKRYVVDHSGLLLEGGNEDIPVLIHDISDGGISFYGQKNLQIYQRDVRVKLDDKLLGEEYNLDLICNCVRVVDAEVGLLFGCKIEKPCAGLRDYIDARRKHNTAATQ